MKKLIMLLGVLAAILVVLTGTVVVVGFLQPVDHVASSRATYAAAPADVWAKLTDYAGWPAWSSAFDTVERLPDRDGRPYWRFEGGYGPMPIVIAEAVAPARLVTQIPEDADIGYYGTWTYVLAPAGAGTRVTITEAGSVPSPVWRGMSRLFLGQHTAMNALLTDLGASLGEDVEPEEL